MSFSNYLQTAFGVSYSEIKLFDFIIPFWIPGIVLLLLLIISNVKILRTEGIRLISFIFNIMRSFFMWLKSKIVILAIYLKNKELKKELQKRYEVYKLCTMLLLISLLLYTSFSVLYDTLRSYLSPSALAITVLILVFVSYVLYALFIPTFSLNSISTTYIIFPILYSILFWAETKYTLIDENVSQLAYRVLVFILLILHIMMANKFKDLKIRIKPVMIVLISLTLFLIGVILIVDFTSEGKSLGLKLNDCKSSKHFENAEITCKDLLRNVVVDSKVYCILENLNSTQLSNISGYFKFTLLNGTSTIQTFQDSIYFTTPDMVGDVYIEMNAYYNNRTICLSSENSQTFPSYEQYRQNKKDFITYLAALLAFLLLSVPSIYDAWGGLFNKK